MPKQITPYFEKGRILKKDALDCLRDYPRDMAAILYQEYCDGVVCGFPISYRKDSIIVGCGILKHNGRLILANEEVKLSIPSYHNSLYCYFSFDKLEEGSDFLIEPYEILLTERECREEGWYELGRFQLEKGAVLRTCEQYKNFPDGDTRVNTLNVIHKKCCGRSGVTVEPKLLKWFGQDLLSMGRLDGFDQGFAILCLNGSLVERNVIVSYLENKLLKEFKDAENAQLFQGLKEVWNRLSGTRGNMGAKGSFRAKRTIID